MILATTVMNNLVCARFEVLSRSGEDNAVVLWIVTQYAVVGRY